MLKKLLKYDLKSVWKVLFVFYALSIFFAVLTRLFLTAEHSFVLTVIGQICGGVTISMIFNIIINNLMRLWARFRQNFYGDESYLTHTLPVKKSTLLHSKVLAAVITLFVSILVIAASLMIAYYSKAAMETLKAWLLPLADAMESQIGWLLAVLLLILFFEFFTALQCGYTGVILGHRMNGGKIGFSILFGFGVYAAGQVWILLTLLIAALFNANIMELFLTNQMNSFVTLKLMLWIAFAGYVLLTGLLFLLNRILFEKGVNVD